MVFVRKKGKYNYLVESYRLEGKVKQRVLAYLGKQESIEERLEELEWQLEHLKAWSDVSPARYKHRFERCRRAIEKLKSFRSAQKSADF